jgi:hypothetical protein
MIESAPSLSGVVWEEAPGNPLLSPPPLSPLHAAPPFLFPADAPDGRWHLFAHSIPGSHHFLSEDGRKFSGGRLVVPNGMRPFLLAYGGQYFLYYERFRSLGLYTSWLPIRWNSRIVVRRSADLRRWSQPRDILSPSLPWHSSEKYGKSVSNPCVLPSNGHFRLYYSASLVRLPDCGFNEPVYFGLAIAEAPEGPFILNREPIMAPDPADPWMNLGCGSMKALHVPGGFIALQNGIYRNAETGETGSAILQLSSSDGVSFRRISEVPLLAPSRGWMRSHVYAFDLRYRAGENRWYLYFNARDDWHWTRGRERIGLLTGR